MFNDSILIASHDLKTPIRNFTSFVSLAKRNITKENKESKSIQQLNMGLTYSNRMNELVNAITNLGSVKHVENVDILKIDLHNYISESFAFYQSQTNKKLVISCPESIILTTRISHCKIIVDNLIKNAIKYNTRDNIIINITRAIHNDSLLIKVADNGIGIHSDYQQSIFNPFSKLHTKEEYEGSGLGLYIVKEVLDIYNGKIYVEESSDCGTTFTIELPQNQDENSDN